MRTVVIDAVLNGWSVKVGCQTLVYNDAKTLQKDLAEYMENPEEKEKVMRSTAINKYLAERAGRGIYENPVAVTTQVPQAPQGEAPNVGRGPR